MIITALTLALAIQPQQPSGQHDACSAAGYGTTPAIIPAVDNPACYGAGLSFYQGQQAADCALDSNDLERERESMTQVRDSKL